MSKEKTTDIQDMSISQLKEMAYDQLRLIEQSQMNLKLLNQQIVLKEKEPK